MNQSDIDELISASENALGFVYGERVEAARETEDLLPIVPQRFRGIAAEQVFTRLDKAVRACRKEQEAPASETSGHYFDY